MLNSMGRHVFLLDINAEFDFSSEMDYLGSKICKNDRVQFLPALNPVWGHLIVWPPNQPDF